MATDTGGLAQTTNGRLVPLAEHNCWALLRGAGLGRLAYVDSGRPRIVPVNYAVVGTSLVIASRPGNKLKHALHAPRTQAILEIDWTGEDRCEGWYVVASGSLAVVTDRVEMARLARTVDPSWLEVIRSRQWLVLEIDSVVGRRVAVAA